MPSEMAVRGTHDRVMASLSSAVDLAPGMTVLDIGAGQGALASRLSETGISVSACDVITEAFDVPGIDCREIDDAGTLPYEDDSFDVAVAVEVVEHVDGHDRFFSEAARVLKPGGTLLFTTPNILSLKSRLRFLLSGTFYSFGPLVPFTTDPVSQHISPFNLNRYAWQLSQHDLRITDVQTDRYQTTSLFFGFLVPFVRLATRVMYGGSELASAQNSPVLLFGRRLMILARKAGAPPESEAS